MCTAELCAFKSQKLMFFVKEPNFSQRQLLSMTWVISVSSTILTKTSCLSKLLDWQPEKRIGINFHKRNTLHSCCLAIQEAEISPRRKGQGPNKLDKKKSV